MRADGAPVAHSRWRFLAGLVTVTALGAALLPVGPGTGTAGADDPPPPMFTCTADVNATPQEQADFADRWAARLLGHDPGFDLQAYVDSATLPQDIAGEVGFKAGTDDTLTRGCLTTKLAETLKTLDPTFGMDTSTNPATAFPEDTVKSMLAMTVFHNKPTSDPADPPAASPIPLPDPVTDALHALGLDNLLPITVPTVTVPTNLGVPTPISAVINDLVKHLQGVGLPQLPPLGNLVQLPALPITLPKLLSLPSVADLINLVRSVVDATSYTVCYKGPKTNGTQCTSSPLGLPVLLDVQGNSVPDLKAQLTPTVAPEHPTGLSMSFTVERLNLANPLQPPPPVPADVTVAWDLPAAQARAHIGFLSTFKTGLSLARRSELRATVTNLNDASQGNPKIAYVITQESPDAQSQVQAGISKLVRNPSSGATTAPETTIATLDFTPVPVRTTGELNIETTAAGPNKVRYRASLDPSEPTVLTLNILRQYPPKDVTQPCCPVQSFTALADKLPKSIKLDILKDESLHRWTVGYTGKATIGHLALQGADYPTAEAANKPEAEQTVSSFSAEATSVPTKVDVVASLPIPKTNPRIVDVSYRGSLATDPDAIIAVPSVDLGTLERVDGDVQRSFKGHAEDVPGRLHVNATLAGDALNTPAGPNLDVDLTYDSSSSAKNLTVDFFDKGEKSTSKLSGTIATLPPWLHAKVGSHPTSNSVLLNAKTDAAAADGSAHLGTVNLKYAKNAEYLSLDATKPTTDQYAVVKTTNGADNTADTNDDGTAVEAQYTGLKWADVSLGDDGRPKGNLDLHAKVVNDADRSTTARFDTPDGNVDAEVLKVPKEVEVTYQRRQAGAVDECGEPENTHKVVYDAVSPIDRAHVRVQGKKNGAPDPDSITIVSAGRDPDDNNAGPIPTHMELFANGQTKRVNYRANGSIGQVAASVLNASPSCGARNGINADLRGVPAAFGASIDPEHLRFANLADTTTPIDQVGLAENTPVAAALRSVAVAFTDHPAGSVPELPATNKLSVVSDKRNGGSIAASVRLGGLERFKLDLNHANPADTDSKVVGVVADLELAGTLADVATNLDFVGDDGEEARVLGTIDKLPPDVHINLGLVDGDTTVHYETPGGHLDANLEIALGTAGQLDTVQLGASRPVGVMIRDSQTCTCAKKVGIFMLGAPRTFDLRVNRVKTTFRSGSEQDFLRFTDYAPPGGNTDLSLDILLSNDAEIGKNLKVKTVLHGVPTGYGVSLPPIATGDDSGTYFDFRLNGNKPIGPADLDVGTGVPEVPNGSAPCSACKMKLTGTISNIPPGVQFHLDSGPSAEHANRKQTNVEMTLLDANGAMDPALSITSAKLNVLTWQLKPQSQVVRTVPQVQAEIREIPAHMKLSITDNGPKDSSFAQPCARPTNTLPGVTYTADGVTRDALDLNAAVDFVMLSDDPTNPDTDAPVLEAGATDLSHSVAFTNTADGKFIVSQPDASAPPTGNLHIEVSDQTMKILNWSLLPPEQDGCGFSKTIGPVTISSEGGLAFNLRAGIVLDVTGLHTVTLEPGIIINVDGNFSNVTFGLRDPRIVDGYASGIGLRFKVRISDSIQPSFPIVFPPVSITGFTFPIDVHLVDLTVNSRSNWIDINLLVPCDVDVSWDGVDITSYHGFVDTLPGLFAESTNGFTTTDNAKFFVFPFDEGISDFLRFALQPTFIAAMKLFTGTGSLDAGIRCPS